MNELPNRDLLLPHEIMKFMRLGRSTIYRWLQEGVIPSKKIGDHYRIPRKEFLAWYEKQPSSEDFLSA